MKKNSLITNFILLIGVLTIVYGFVCRLTDTYYFWESKYVGLTILMLGVIGIMIDRIKINKTLKKKSILQKITIGIMVFIIGFQISWISFIPFTESYKMTEKSILENNFLKQDIGEIKSIQIIPSGNIKTEKNLNGEKTYAHF